MFEAFARFVEDNQLFSREDRILIAVSGGIDSIALVNLMQRYGVTFGIAHANFDLRKSESDEDEKFVRSVAEKLGVPFYSQKFKTKDYSSKEGVSIQMAARALRYKWFDELLDREKFHYLATAHHRNDLVETSLINLVRGTGISGLHGIRARMDKIIRPMLFTNRESIEKFVRQEGMNWREDSSNVSEKYDRNYIRKKIVPKLKVLNPNLEETFWQSAQRINQVEEVFKDVLTDISKAACKRRQNDLIIELEKLQGRPGSDVLLFELIRPYGFNFSQLQSLIQSIDSTGKKFISATHQLIVDRKQLIISERSKDETDEIFIGRETKTINFSEGALQIFKIDASVHNVSADPNTASLDYEKLSFPLKLRKWQHGDSFFPLGMKHKKKVSDFMIDSKFPLNLKAKTHLLISGKDVAWVVGWRIDERFKISAGTTKVYCLKLLRDDKSI